MKIHKKMTNLEIAELLNAVAAAYKISGREKNRFRIVAYERAGDAVEHMSSEAKDLWDDGKLESVAGIGESMAAHLDEIFKTGKSKHFEKVMKGLPPAMFELMKVSGIGPKTAYKLAKELRITESKGALTRLEKAVKEGKVTGIEGLGEKSGESIQKSIKETKTRKKRLLLPYATNIAKNVIGWMRQNKSVKKIDSLGSLRRRASTIGDIDIAVATDDPKSVLEHFVKYPDGQRVLERGEATASIILPGSVQVDLMTQPPGAYGALLQHFTGSKHHNVALREFALKKGMSLSEKGIKKGGKMMSVPTEERFYKKLGLDWIPPELREDFGEIEAAGNGNLPRLVELKDIKGDLQIHSDFDIETSHDVGASSMEEVIEKASELDYEYIAFTEHNPSKSKHSESEIINLLKKKKEKIEQINTSLVKSLPAGRQGVKQRVKKVFNSLEIDILPDGKLPVSDEGMELLDFALVSIHSSFRQGREVTTRRVLSALTHPKVKIFAHPTGRKLNEREGVEIDWPKVFDFCIENNKWIEINAEPMRLDLPDMLVRDAIKAGVVLTMGTDAHHKDGLDNMINGVSVARRGWATKDSIVNTRSLQEFERLL